MDTMMPACCSLYLPRRGADAGKAQRCPDLAVALAMKRGGADLDPHVFNQFSIRAALDVPTSVSTERQGSQTKAPGRHIP